MDFAHIEYLFLLLLIIPYLLWYLLYGKKSEPSMRVSNMAPYRYAPRSWKIIMMPILMFLRILAFVLLVIVMARPQSHDSWKEETREGIDIMLALDVSTSMLAEDLKPNRLEAAKNVAAEFIDGRSEDNIGLTIFAGEAFTQCPMTIDHAALLRMLKSVRTDIAARGIISDGTAVGMGLSNAISRLSNSKAKSKVIILLTDGVNNLGDISPMMAAEMAKTYNIRVYTIAVGANGYARYPMPVAGGIKYVDIPVEVDTQTLTQIAEMTDGTFYRAKNATELKDIYQKIDKLEKSKLDVKQIKIREEMYQPFAIAALISLLLELFMRITIFRRIP